MKILFVCRFLPHPNARDSGAQDTYHYIAELRRRHAVSLIAFVPPQEQAAVQFMRQICAKVETVPYSPTALTGRLWRAWWRLVFPKVYGRVFSIAYRRQLRKLVAQEPYDVVIVDGMMAQYGLLIRNAKRILDEVDIYATVAYHTYRRERRFLRRLSLLGDWLHTYLAELHYARHYEGIVTRSQKDKIFLQELVPGHKIGVLQPWFEGLTTELRSIPDTRPPGNKLLFVGAMNHPKNIEAVLYFVHQIFPLVRAQIPDVTFSIVGGNPTPTVCALAQIEGVEVTGAVEDLTPYYAAAAVNVVPLLVGGGMITKTLNGMASARPTVATSAGNAGTGAQAGEDLVVADSTQAFAEAVVHLLQDQETWLKFARQGRHYVVTHYNWQEIIRSFELFLRSIC